MQDTVPTLIAPVARYSRWESSALPEGSPRGPDVSFVEPMLRRRLSALARMTLSVANECAQDLPDVRFVFASRHGELGRTMTLLDELAAEGDLSPALFSLSVLNASTGLFSMMRKNTAPSSAISAGCSSFGYGLIEAALQLSENPEQPVLYVYADEPVPEVYDYAELPGSTAHAIGLLLQSSAKQRISLLTAPSTGLPSHEAQSRAFLRCLDEGDSLWNGEGKSWRWTTSRC